MRAEGYAPMDDMPEWIKNLGFLMGGGFSVLGASVLKFKFDTRKLLVDDRASLTAQLMTRVAALEASQAEERRFCEERLAAAAAEADRRLEARDRIITEMRQRVTALESQR